MIEVEIKDFQAIDTLKVQIDGFTAIVGRSNVGKSSIIRALKCALTGAEGTDFVRHNPESCARVLRGVKKCSCQSSVLLKFADGRKLLWEKGDAINQYTAWSVEGEKTVYSSVGRGTDAPSMLAEGFDPVEIGQKKSLLQVADQFDPVFLLNLSGTIVADVLSDVAQLDEINGAMRSVSKDRRAASSTRKVRDTDVKTIQEKLTKYNGLDAAASKARRVQDTHIEVSGKAQVVGQVSQFISDYVRAGTALRALQEAVKPTLPGVDPLNVSAIRYGSASQLLGSLEVGVRSVRSLMGVKDVKVPDVAGLKQLSVEAGKAGGFYKRLSEGESLLTALDGVGDLKIPTVDELRATVDTFKAVSSWRTRLVQLKAIFDKYKGVSKVDVEGLDPKKLREAVAQTQKAKDFYARFSTLEKAIEDTESELNSASTEEAEILAEFGSLGRCPTCSQDITPHHKGHG